MFNYVPTRARLAAFRVAVEMFFKKNLVLSYPGPTTPSGRCASIPLVAPKELAAGTKISTSRASHAGCYQREPHSPPRAGPPRPGPGQSCQVAGEFDGGNLSFKVIVWACSQGHAPVIGSRGPASRRGHGAGVFHLSAGITQIVSVSTLLV